jgi:hypothetical protein
METRSILGDNITLRTLDTKIKEVDGARWLDPKQKELVVVVYGPSNHQNLVTLSESDSSAFIASFEGADCPKDLCGKPVTAYYDGTTMKGVQKREPYSG